MVVASKYFIKRLKQTMMGVIQKGILGGFSGKVGTVVGGSWKGIDYMRSKSAKRNFMPTPAQQEQQAKFKLMVAFLHSMSGLLADSFRNYAIKMTGFNNALSYNLKNAVVGLYPSYTVDYSMVLVSRGDLPNAIAPKVTAAAGSLINYAWVDNTGTGKAKATDLTILVVYCESTNQSLYVVGGAARSIGTDTLNVANFKGKLVETYLGFISADGREVASSMYTGQVTVLV